MECIDHKSIINEIFSSVRDMSYKSKKDPFMNEEGVNFFLDAINDLKTSLREKTDEIYSLNEEIESITWFNDLDEECLMLINDLISSARELRSSLVRQYVLFDPFRLKGIAKKEIGDFKNSIDELKEICQDLDSVFFFLPENSDFQDVTKELSLV